MLRSIAGRGDPPVSGNNPAKSRRIPGAPSNDRAQIPQGRKRSLGQDAASGQTTEPPTPRTSRSGRGKGLPDRWFVRVRGNVTRALPRSSDATTACPHAVEHNAVEHPARAHWRIVRAIVTIDRSHVAIPQGRAGSAGAREASVNPDTSGPARSANVEAGQDPGWLPGFSGMLSSVC